MNSFLLSLGIAIALILVAAFAAPFFIDWSSYRSYFEARASEIIGRPVTFEGDLSVRIVPFPRLVAENARIGGEGSGEGVARIDMGAALTPLLSGELKVTELTLEHPNAVLRLDPSGRVSWAAAGEPSVPVSPDRIAIDRFEIVDGEFTIDDERSGRTFALSDVNLSGSATSLVGPFKVEGGGIVDGERYTVRVATGRLADDGTGMRVKASVLPAARPLTIELDGALLRVEGTPAFDGKLVMERPAVDAGSATWRMESQIVASPETLVLERMSIRLGTESQSVSLTGAATVQLGADPRFDAVVSARQVDFDRAFGAGPDEPVSPQAAVAKLGTLFDPAIFPIPGHLALDVESAVVSGGLMEGLSVDLEVDDSTWSIERATATAPGRTSLGIAGTIGFGGEVPQFDGAVRLSTEQATVFANWALGPQARLPGFALPAGSLDMSGQVRLDGAGMLLERVEIESDEARVGGSLVLEPAREGKRGRLAVALTADWLALSDLEASGVGTDIGLLEAVEALLSGTDLQVQVQVDTLDLNAIEARSVMISATVADGDVRIDELEIGDLGGARLTGGGEVRSFASAPDGNLQLDVSATSLDGIVAALKALGADRPADALAARGSALVPAKIRLALAAARTETGSKGELSLNGTTGGSALAGRVAYDGRIDDIAAASIDVSLSADNTDAARLAEQLGIPPDFLSNDAGRVSLQASGRARDAVDYRVSAEGIGIDGTAEGTARWPARGGREVTGTISARFADPAGLLDLAGLSLPVSEPMPATLSGTLSATDDVWRFANVDIDLDGSRLNGRLDLDLGGAQRVLGGKLQADRIELSRLAAALVGEDAMRFPDVGYGEAAWPSAILTPVKKAGWRGHLDLAAPSLVLFDGVVLTEAATTLSFDEARISLDGMRGNLFGGKFAGTLELAETEGIVALTGQADLSAGRLEEIIWRENGRAVASGQISIGGEFTGRGRSLAAIAASLSGTGSFTVSEGVLRRLNPHAFDQIISAADAGLELTEDKVRQTFAGHLDSGSLRFQSMEGAFSISSGLLRANNIRIDTQDLRSFASATIDLPLLGLDSEWTLQTDVEEEGGRMREVGVVFAGPIAAPERQIDVNPLLGYLTVRAFEQEVERLEKLQTEILERQRLSRELIRQGQERVRREREKQLQEQAAREQQNAERQAQEERARRVEAERLRAQEDARLQAEAEARRIAEEERRRTEEATRRQAEEAARRRAEEANARASPPPPAVTQPQPPPQLQQQGGNVGNLDNTDLQRRIEDILRDIPSARSGPLPSGGVMTPEQPPAAVAPPSATVAAPPAPGIAPGQPAPPLNAPLIISPQPGGPQIGQPQTVVDQMPQVPPDQTDNIQPQDRVFR